VNSAAIRLACLLAVNCSLLSGAQPALLWSDNFFQEPGSAPDPSKWVYDLGAGGWGNNELQTYTNSRENSFVIDDPNAADGRALAIRAIRTPTGGYTSARLKTQGRYSVTYGRIEARIKVTRGRGIWPAFWMLGDSITSVGWPACGEIDIMEHLGHDPGRVYGTLHGPGYSGGSGLSASTTLPNGASLSDNYHVFAVDWTPTGFVWSLDGVPYAMRKASEIPNGARWVFDSPEFMILNLAVGGNWPGYPDASTVFPQTLLVDHVRVYGLAPEAPATLAAYSMEPGRVELSWTKSPATFGQAITGYRLERAADPGFTTDVTRRDLGAATSYTDAVPSSSGPLYYRIAAISAGGTSSASPAATVRPLATASSGSRHRLINLATRATVGTGDAVTIAGFVLTGDAPTQLLIRGVGPTLGSFGVNGVLGDPIVSLLNSEGGLLATNDNWSDQANAIELGTAGTRAGAFPMPAGSRDAALLATLAPGGYTVKLSGAADSTGVALIEIYELP